MRTSWSFRSAGQLVFGRGAASQIGPLARRINLSRVFLVTDQRLASAGLVERVVLSLANTGIQVEVFQGGEPEPAVTTAVEAAEQAAKFEPDGILGLGGGSNMDLAKIVAVLVTHGGEPARYFSFDNVPGPILPLVCLPTTAGTGSEVGRAALLVEKAEEDQRMDALGIGPVEARPIADAQVEMPTAEMEGDRAIVERNETRRLRGTHFPFRAAAEDAEADVPPMHPEELRQDPEGLLRR